MLKFLDALALLSYCALIFWLSDQQHLPVPKVFEVQDKVIHMAAYFVMGVLAWRSFRYLVPPYKLLAWISVAFCSLYGISDEWHQSFVMGRSSEVLDWVADTIGASIAVMLITRLIMKPQGLGAQRAKTIQNP